MTKIKSLKFHSIAATVVLAIICCVAQTANAQDPKVRAPVSSDGPLAWKYKSGQVLGIKMNQEVNTTIDVGPQKIESVNKSINEMTLTIESVDDAGVATAKNVIDRMVVETSAPGVEIKYDSAKKDQDDAGPVDFAKMFEPMVGAEMRQKMSKLGEVTDVELPEGMMDGIKSANPMVAQMFNENTIKAMSESASLIFPDKKIEVGETWSTDKTIEMGPVAVKNKTDFEYLGVSDSGGKPLHVIRGKISMEFVGNVNGVKVDVVEEDSTTWFYFDGNAGRLEKTNLDQNVTMEINAGPQVMTQILKQKMDLKFAEKK